MFPSRPYLLVLALSGIACGRIGYDSLELAKDDAGLPDVDASSTQIVNDDPSVLLQPGWNLAIEHDLSSSYTYVAEDFFDGTWQNNRPAALAHLQAPFPAGFAVGTGRELLHVDLSGNVTRHEFSPAAANMGGPDKLGSLLFAPAGIEAFAEARLIAGAASTTGGDGVFAIAPDWSLTRLDAQNNVSMVAIDPDGVVPGYAEPSLYLGWRDSNPNVAGLRSLGDVQEVNLIVGDGTILADGRMLVVQVEPDPFVKTRLTLIDNWIAQGVSPYIDDDRTISKGDPRSLGADAIIVSERPGAITTWNVDGSSLPIASQGNQDWEWVRAVVVPTASLGSVTASLYLLRYKVDYSELQILRLWKTP